jgi:hypothetical protein
MKAEDFLKSKKISKPTYEGVRLVDSGMNDYRIVDLLNEYAKIIQKQVNGVDASCEQALPIQNVSDMLFDFAQFIWECDKTHILDIYIEEYLSKNNYR